jgi:hypothetical protein
MAKTASEVYDVMTAEQVAQTGLVGLEPAGDNARLLLQTLANDPSAADPYRLLKWVVATAVSLVTQLWDRAKAEQQQIAAEGEVTTDAWLRGRVLNWQEGDPIVFVNNAPAYAVVDATKRLAAFCTVRTTRRNSRIVVAKADGAGLPVPFTGAELTELQTYLNRLAPVGTNPVAQTAGPDLMRFGLTVYYDGQIEFDRFVDDFKDATAARGKALTTDGLLRAIDLVDSWQAVPGFKNVDVQYLEAKAAVAVAWSAYRMQYPATGAAVVPDWDGSLITYTAV